ncbi:hypothetical protein POM88_038864 [Heracleum sosnowskyi]|uniref:Uncharacterized protein n=1 Tax=Heracleum sosnowskyi TaxID=360622 RepID=A0AAD8M8T1_9APIA|nr:hypothetical protein POM88_038864 [Heracleum sosnowskyi]
MLNLASLLSCNFKNLVNNNNPVASKGWAKSLCNFLIEVNKLPEARIGKCEEVLKSGELEMNLRERTIAEAKCDTVSFGLKVQEELEGSNIELQAKLTELQEEMSAKASEVQVLESDILSKEEQMNLFKQSQMEIKTQVTGLEKKRDLLQQNVDILVSTKRRVRGRNVETILQISNYDENQDANRRVRGKNGSNALSSADSTNNKENFSPNVASVTTNLRRLPQSILHDPATLPSDHVGKNITGKNVSKCRVRGKNVDNIMSNVSKQAYSRPPLTTIDQNSQSPFISQSSGSTISSKSHLTPRTTFHSRLETINLSGDMQRNQTNKNHKNTDQSGQSTLTFSMPASTLKPINKRRPDYKKQHPPDETEQHVAKKSCGKMSPIPFSVGKDGVRSNFEVGETSSPKNLISDFNNIEDTFSSESDSLEQDPLRLWEAHWRCMSDDIILLRRHLLDDHTLFLSDDNVQKYALAG